MKIWRLQKPHMDSFLPIHAILASNELCLISKTSKESPVFPLLCSFSKHSLQLSVFLSKVPALHF